MNEITRSVMLLKILKFYLHDLNCLQIIKNFQLNILIIALKTF